MDTDEVKRGRGRGRGSRARGRGRGRGRGRAKKIDDIGNTMETYESGVALVVASSNGGALDDSLTSMECAADVVMQEIDKENEIEMPTTAVEEQATPIANMTPPQTLPPPQQVAPPPSVLAQTSKFLRWPF